MYIGVDLHKKYSYVTRMTQEGEITFQGRVEHKPDSLRDFVESISEDDNIAVEATCNWYYFYELIEGQTPNVSLAHPLKTRAMASAMVKTDKIDSKILAYLLRADMLPESYIPNRETRDLREILRYRASLVKIRTQMKNKIHAILSKDGVSSPYSDLFGKKGIQFLQDMELRPCYRQAIDGYLATIEQLNDLLKAVSLEINQRAKLDEQAQLLMTMPGIGCYSAMLILSEIGDITRFPDAKHLVSYAGLAPRVHSSGGKTHYGRITKQGSRWLRWILIEISHHGIRGSFTFRQLYQRVSKKHGKNTARVAVARKMLCIIYHMLIKKEAFRDKEGEDKEHKDQSDQ
jgi:transposase